MLANLTLARGLLIIVVSVMLVTPASAQTSIQQRPQTEMQQLQQQQQGGASITGPRRQIPGGPGSFTSLSGTEEADFCCKSGQGGQGNECTQYDPTKAVCQDFTLHCDGSWSCQPNGSSCECL